MKLIKKLLLTFLVIPVLLLGSNFVKSYEYELCKGFTSEKVPADIEKLIKENSCIEDPGNDFIRIDDLRYLRMKHWGFDDKEHDGEMLVNELIAEEVLQIFKELYDNKFPIYQMKLIERFGSDDEASMSANNTTALRVDKGSLTARRPSWHALGFAIDINPLNNPCSYPNAEKSEPKFVPHNAEKYLDRSIKEKGMINKESICYKVFNERGWEWGGSWTDPLDLHHFQKYSWKLPRPRKYAK